MNRTWIALAAVLLPVIFGMSLAGHSRSNQSQEGVAGGVKPMTVAPVVIVELFTSEGCSSCPPADQLLKKLSDEQPIHGAQIVALEEHVDYWNHQGWKDPFSAAEFSRRQEDYAGGIHTGGVYTPQMIVDGQVEVTGSQGRKAWEAIEQTARMPKANVEVSNAAGEAGPSAAFDLRVSNASGGASRKKLELWLAVTEKELQSDVKAGENSGETLKHAPVVRSLQRIAVVESDEPFTKRVIPKLKQEWKLEQLSLVAFVVEKDSRKIVGGAITPFPAKN